MKNSIFFNLIAAIVFMLGFSACFQDSIQDVLPAQHSTNGFVDATNTDVEKYIPAKGQRVTGRYIVQLTNETMMPGSLLDTLSKTNREALAKSAEKRLTERSQQMDGLFKEWGIGKDKILYVYTEAISGFSADLTEDEVSKLLADKRVLSLTEDQLVELEMPKFEAVGMPKTQTTPCGITRHNGPSTGPSSKWIWIVDSGIFQHSDLNVVTNSTFAKSFVGGSPFDDCLGHGTHVAGTAAAKNNSMGVVGMSAGASVVPVRVFGCNSGGTLTGILAGINHVALYDEAGDVCNLSLGNYYGSGCSMYSPYKNAVNNLAVSGTWVVIAAGNDGANAANFEPGCLNGTRILTVANMDCSNNWNWGSNFGIGPIDWIAVGTNVLSTWPGNQYNYLTGTSMSAPHVAGIVHARQSNPVQCGWVYRYNVGYKVACR
jgi:subtilisin family serine protease